MLTVELERLRLTPGTRLLDVGCGGGRHIRASRHLPGVAAVAIDLGAKEVEETRASLELLDKLPPADGGSRPDAGPWAVARGSVYELPFADASFDCVIISEVLEHLHREDDALRELWRVLKPGGVLAVSVPRTLPEAICWALSPQYRNSPGGHVRIYLRSQLERLIESHGYRVTGRHFAHGLHSPYWWLRCALGMDNETIWPVALYHRFLMWDLLHRPALTRWLDAALSPLIGKSVVVYAEKQGAAA
ncbi:MAG TPA: class I SAM-dependent methyltransferase [Candidatus Limnocylindria bacterium]|nr:class I SAM-dependent methyltransferase [Candidatus Limnocylindria bacterium]